MSIFGDETIIPDDSPLDGQEEEGTVGGTEPEDGADDYEQDDLDSADDEEANSSDDEELDDEDDDTPPQDGQGNDLILGKFKSQDELAKAYTELQRQFTQERMQKSQQQAQGQQPIYQQQQGSQQDPNQLFWDNFKQDPLGTLRYLVSAATQQTVAPIMEQRQTETLARNIESVAKEYKQLGTPDGMKQLMHKVAEIAEQDFGNLDLAKNPSPRLLKMAAQELYGDTKAELYKKAKQKGREEAEATRRKKQGLSAPSNSKKPAAKTAEDDIADSIVAAGRGGGIFG